MLVEVSIQKKYMTRFDRNSISLIFAGLPIYELRAK